MRGKTQRYMIENVLKNILIVFERKKQRRASLIMLPRMKSISDCNVCRCREKSCKTIENLAGFNGNFLKSFEKI